MPKPTKAQNLDDVIAGFRPKKTNRENIEAHAKNIHPDHQADLMNDILDPAGQAAKSAAYSKLDSLNYKNDDTIKKETDVYAVLNAYMEAFIERTRPAELATFRSELKSLNERDKHEILSTLFDRLATSEQIENAHAISGYARSIGKRDGVKVRTLKRNLREWYKGHAQAAIGILNAQSRAAYVDPLPHGVYATELATKVGAEVEKPTQYYTLPTHQLDALHQGFLGKTMGEEHLKEYGLKPKKKAA